MTLEEILKNNGVGDAEVGKIVEDMKNNKIFTTNEENLEFRFNKLKGQHDTLTNDTKDYTDLKNKVTQYEGEIETLKNDLEKTKVDSALKVALLNSGVSDVDYITFKIKEKGEITLDEKGEITGLKETIDSLKTQYPQHFSGSVKKIDEKKLDEGNDKKDGLTKKELLSKPYAERLKIFQENPENFNEIMNS